MLALGAQGCWLGADYARAERACPQEFAIGEVMRSAAALLS